jgi:hypothetical protein
MIFEGKKVAMTISKSQSDAFEAAVTEHFVFLEQDFGLTYAGSTTVQEDPRDSYVVARYQREDFRVDIAWGPVDMSLGVLIRLNNSGLRRRERYVYFEPFIEFTSEGSLLPVVPQIYPSMSIGGIEEAMKRRSHLFEHEFSDVLGQIAERLRMHLATLENVPTEMVRKYLDWYQARGRAVNSRDTC